MGNDGDDNENDEDDNENDENSRNVLQVRIVCRPG
jgi:hypothetical protein